MTPGIGQFPSLLVAGLSRTPDTVLRRLVQGLVRHGLDVTIGSSKDPRSMLEGVRWLRTPSWDEPLIRRLRDVWLSYLKGSLAHPADYRRIAAAHGRVSGALEQVRLRHRFGPFMGRRWDVMYFPWISSAVEHLPVFEQARAVVVSGDGTQVNVAPHCPARAEMVREYRLCFGRVSAVHCGSQAMVESACEMGLERGKAVVIRPAVDPDQLVPRESESRTDRPLSISCVGDLAWVMGHEWALMAVRECVDRGLDLRLDLVGDGPERSRVLYTIGDLGLSRHVQWHGKLPVDRVAAIVRDSDVFLQTSISGGISSAVLEAMSCGVPIVTTESGGMGEAVRDGVEGFVTEVGNSRAIAEAIWRLGRDRECRRVMGEAGRRRVIHEFNLKGYADRWVELLVGVAGFESARTASPRPVVD